MPSPDRLVALSEQLRQAHQALRERLSALRREASDGRSRAGAADVAGEPLSHHCLAFCAAIGAHHTGEDSQVLPALRAAAPELAPVIDNLIEDHSLVAGLLGRLRELLSQGMAASSPDALARELDGLAAILESHFSYEERRIAAALDSLGANAWSAGVFAPGQDPDR